MWQCQSILFQVNKNKAQVKWCLIQSIGIYALNCLFVLYTATADRGILSWFSLREKSHPTHMAALVYYSYTDLSKGLSLFTFVAKFNVNSRARRRLRPRMNCFTYVIMRALFLLFVRAYFAWSEQFQLCSLSFLFLSQHLLRQMNR